LELQNSGLLPRTKQRSGRGVQCALDCNRYFRSSRSKGNPYSATNIGTQTLDTSQITNFIPFEDLTNDEVVAWTQGAMGAEQVTQIESSIDKQIQDLITPTSITLTVGEPVPPVEE